MCQEKGFAASAESLQNPSAMAAVTMKCVLIVPSGLPGVEGYRQETPAERKP
jgi:hypothetical protein